MRILSPHTRRAPSRGHPWRRLCSGIIATAILGSLTIPSASAEEVTAETPADAATTGISFNGATGSETYDSILGDAKYFNVVANHWKQSESQTNAAVGTITPSDQVGDDLSKLNRQVWVVGTIEGNNPLQIKGYETDLYLGESHESKVENLKPAGFAGTKVNLHSRSAAGIQAWVRDVIDGIAARSLALADKSSLTPGTTLPTPNTDGQPANQMTTNYELDFRGKPSGTYYVDVTSIYDQLNDDGLNILKNEGQTVVLNHTGTSLKFKRYRVNGTQGNENFPDASTVIWNMPNATSVDWAAHVTGTFIAPKATVTMSDGSSAGWIVADIFDNMGGKEWHSTWRPTIPSPEPEPKTAKFTLKANKTLEGAWESAVGICDKQYQFNLVRISKDEVENFKPAEFDPDDRDHGYLALAKRQIVASAVNGKSNDREHASAQFSEIEVSEAGTYYYVMYEVVPKLLENVNVPWDSLVKQTQGVVYDQGIALVTVTVVEDEQTGDLQVEPIVYDNNMPNQPNSAGEFENRYMDVQGRFAINGTKRFEGGELENGMFTFKIEAVTLDANGDDKIDTDEGPLPPNVNKDTGEIKNEGTAVDDTTLGVFRSGDISFQHPGVYWYHVTEVKGADTNVEYDPTNYWVLFDLTNFADTDPVEAKIYKGTKESPDLKNGYLADEDTVAFTNRNIRKDKASVTLEGSKHLAYAGSDQALAFTGEYSFELFDKDPSEDSQAKAIQTASTKENGAFAFNPIKYDFTGDQLADDKFPQTHTYWIKEINDGTQTNITYDTHVTTVTVTIVKVGDGLTATASYDNTALTHDAWKSLTDKAHFVNVPPRPEIRSDEVSFGAKKRMSSGSLGGHVFQFTLEAENNDSPMPSGAKNGKLTVTNKGERVDFGKAVYTAADVGTHHYTIREIARAGDGIGYDSSVYTATVTVTVDGNTVDAELEYADANGDSLEVSSLPQFVNRPPSTTPEPGRISTSLGLKALKTLKDQGGKKKALDDKFTFELLDKNGTLIGTATNDANGWVQFEPLHFSYSEDEADFIKTYEYIIREVEESSKHPHITFDRHSTKVTVTVTKRGDKLTAVVSYDNSAITTDKSQSSVTAQAAFVNVEEPEDPEDPEEPEEPEEPKEPTKPVTPPTTTTTTRTPRTPTRLAKTGINLAGVALLALSLLTAGVLFLRRRI